MTDFHRPFRDDATPAPAEGPATLSLMRTCFADEIAIDFPSIAPAVDRVRETFVSSDDRAVALENGRVVLSGPARELLADDRLKKAYLGM